MPSTETMMPPFCLTCANHSWSSFTSLLARSRVQYASNKYRISRREILTPNGASRSNILPCPSRRRFCPHGKKSRRGRTDDRLGRRSRVLAVADGGAHLGTTWADADTTGAADTRSPVGDQWHHP